MVAERPEELFLAISAHSGIFSAKVLPSVCTGGWISLLWTARKQEFRKEKNLAESLSKMSVSIFELVHIFAPD